jgi:hypothetical protein
MAKKSGKRHDADVRKLTTKVTKLQARLKNAEASKAAWKAQAKRFEAEALETAKQLKKIKKLRKTEARSLHASPGHATAAAATTSAASGLPDESWTVARLRFSAREAGVPGYSRMTKAALLDALTRSGEEASPH